MPSRPEPSAHDPSDSLRRSAHASVLALALSACGGTTPQPLPHVTAEPRTQQMASEPGSSAAPTSSVAAGTLEAPKAESPMQRPDQVRLTRCTATDLTSDGTLVPLVEVARWLRADVRTRPGEFSLTLTPGGSSSRTIHVGTFPIQGWGVILADGIPFAKARDLLKEAGLTFELVVERGVVAIKGERTEEFAISNPLPKAHPVMKPCRGYANSPGGTLPPNSVACSPDGTLALWYARVQFDEWHEWPQTDARDRKDTVHSPLDADLFVVDRQTGWILARLGAESGYVKGPDWVGPGFPKGLAWSDACSMVVSEHFAEGGPRTCLSLFDLLDVARRRETFSYGRADVCSTPGYAHAMSIIPEAKSGRSIRLSPPARELAFNSECFSGAYQGPPACH